MKERFYTVRWEIDLVAPCAEAAAAEALAIQRDETSIATNFTVRPKSGGKWKPVDAAEDAILNVGPKS